MLVSVLIFLLSLAVLTLAIRLYKLETQTVDQYNRAFRAVEDHFAVLEYCAGLSPELPAHLDRRNYVGLHE